MPQVPVERREPCMSKPSPRHFSRHHSSKALKTVLFFCLSYFNLIFLYVQNMHMGTEGRCFFIFFIVFDLLLHFPVFSLNIGYIKYTGIHAQRSPASHSALCLVLP